MKNKILLTLTILIFISTVYAATECIPYPCTTDEDCIGVIEITKGKSWEPGCKNPGKEDSCCKETFCGIWCTIENEISKCNDDDPTTSDRCINPDTCDAKCVHTSCQPECEEDADCDDDDNTTGDSCRYSGTCQARCFHDKCPVTCTTNDDCPEKQVCFLPGLCNAYCAELVCDSPPECSVDEDCDDNDEITTDRCVDTSSCEAHCTHTACPIACSADDDCDDQKESTLDTCVNPGKCNAECTHKDLGFLNVELETTPNTEYKIGNKISITVLVNDSEGDPIPGADLILYTPQKKEAKFTEDINGKYSINYTIPEMDLGPQTFEVRATKTLGNNAVRGLAKFDTKILANPALQQEKPQESDLNMTETGAPSDQNNISTISDQNVFDLAGTSLMFTGTLLLIIIIGIIISGVIILIYLKVRK